ncbi:hypothetical protein IAU59_002293 [Kwoniella sp. CBS 9459]
MSTAPSSRAKTPRKAVIPRSAPEFNINDEMEPEIQAILSHLASTKKGQEQRQEKRRGQGCSDSDSVQQESDITSSTASGPSFPRFDFLSDKTPLTPARRIRGAIKSTPSKLKSTAKPVPKAKTTSPPTPVVKTQTVDLTGPVKITSNGQSQTAPQPKTPGKRSQKLKVIDLTDDKLDTRSTPKVQNAKKKATFVVDEGAKGQRAEPTMGSVYVPVVKSGKDEVESLNIELPPLNEGEVLMRAIDQVSQTPLEQPVTEHNTADQETRTDVITQEDTVDMTEEVQTAVAQDTGEIIEVLDNDEDDVDGLLQLSPDHMNITAEAEAEETLDPAYDSPPPSLTTKLVKHSEAASPTPIFIASDPEPEPDSDIESDSASEPSFMIARTPRKAPARRILVMSDSESEIEGHIGICDSGEEDEPKHSSGEVSEQESVSLSPVASGGGSPRRDRKKKPSIGSKSTRPSVTRYIADQAVGRDEDSDSEAEGAEDYDDDSLGSLRDFIVDDDEELSEYAEDSEGDAVSGSENESDGIEILDSPPPRPRDMIRKGKNEGNEGLDKGRPKVKATREDPGVLYYSPPRRNKSLDLELDLPDLNALTIFSSSDEEDDDAAPRPSQPPPSERKAKPTSREREPATEKTREQREKERKHKSRKTAGSTKADFSAKAWAEERTRIADSIFKDLDRRVFEGKVGGSDGAGARIEWNKRLLTTAGVARSKRTTKNGQTKREFWIELSEKVLTGEKQIINTVAHEMCHLATWIISNDYKNAHGSVFKSWGRKVMRARNDVEVTTKHSYEIEYKYEWKCGNERCGKIYKRHSKSIDTTKHACGACKGKLAPLFDTKQKTASSFQLYLKENMKFAKAAMPKASHGDVMRALSKRWTDVGSGSANGGDVGTETRTGTGMPLDHLVYWKSLASAASK